MRFEKANRFPRAPRWAVAIVVAHLSLVGLYVWIDRATGGHAPSSCLFHRLTGCPCPACGSTRMVLAVVEGDLAAAVRQNPLMFSLAILALILLVVRVAFRRRIVWITSAGSRRFLTGTLVVIVLINWLYLLAMF